MPKNPFTTFKNNYSGNPSGTEKAFDAGVAAEMHKQYTDLYHALHGIMHTGKSDPKYGTYAKQTEIMKHVAKRMDEFEKTAGTYLEQALKDAAHYQTKLALSDLSLLEEQGKKPEQFHYDFNDEYAKKAFTDSFEHIAAQTGRMTTTVKHHLQQDTKKIMKRAAVEGWPRKKAYKELKSEVLGRDPGFKFVDKRGREWKSEDYFDMLTKTVMKNLQNECYTNTLINEGRDLVKVNHNGATDPCKYWEGKVLSLTGATPGYTTLEEATATGEVFHPRCRHRLLAYDPEMDNVFDMLDAGVTAGKVIGSTKKAVREAVDAVPEEVSEVEKVGSRFKDPAHQVKYLKYLDEERAHLTDAEEDLKMNTGKTFKDIGGMHDPFGSNKDEATWRKRFKRPMKHWMLDNTPHMYKALDSWQGSTHGTMPMLFKVLHAKLEGDAADLMWRDDGQVDGKKAEIADMIKKPGVVDEYIRVRAANQAYMEKIGLTEIDLIRGTGGRAGKAYARQLEATPNATHFELKDANLAGYTTSQKIGCQFGVDDRGVTVHRVVKASDIIVHQSMFCGITGGYTQEYEYIVKGGTLSFPMSNVAYNQETRHRSAATGNMANPQTDSHLDKPPPPPPKPAPSEIKKAKQDANTQTVKFQGSTGWVEEFLDKSFPLPPVNEVLDYYKNGKISAGDYHMYKAVTGKVSLDEAKELYQNGLINKDDYDAYKANMKPF